MSSQADAVPSLVFAPNLEPPGASLRLSSEESHYVARVCRARVGDLVRATDGRGLVAALRIIAVDRQVVAEVEAVRQHERRQEVWMWCGAPEGQRGDWLVEKLAELGIAAWQPLQCERGAWPVGREGRWRRLAISAMRQSRRPFLMETRTPLGLPAAIGALPDGSARWFATQDGEPGWSPAPGGALAIGVVGPAGGFSPAEESSLRTSGFRAIRLGEATLRCETAAVAWAARWAL
jgi:16S rRNA (uracil1498-N3)-methyltransferase